MTATLSSRLRALVLACLGVALGALPASAQAPAQSVAGAPRTPPVDAPEIDPSLTTGILVLLVGGVLVLTSRGRRRGRAS